MRQLLAVLLLACPGPFAVAQVPPLAPTSAPTEPAGQDSTNRRALENLATQIGELRQSLQEANSRSDRAAATRIGEELASARWQFAELAAHFDVQQFEAPQAHTFDLKSEVEELLRPVVALLKNATETPRLVNDLRSQLKVLQQRREVIERAIRTVEQTRDALPAQSPARAEAQKELDDRWRKMLDTVRRDELVASARLQQLSDSTQSLWDRFRGATREFVQSSGLSLLLAVLVFVGLFFGLRFLIARAVRRPTHYRSFSRRLLDVVLQLLTLLIAVAGTLAVPYVRNDWLLLAVGIVFLVGAGWALMRVLPLMVEQMRLVLNVGGVREGERILLDGLPYRVDALRFHTRLHNPDLEGGELRVPIKELIGKRSRRSATDEPWFPCRTGDVVALTDGVLGVVRQQTPEIVVVAEPFDAPRTYPTTTFLQLHPKNLSKGFRINTTFGIDYAHQQEATTTLPQRLHAFVVAGLTEQLPAGELVALRIELQAAGTSSIDYAVLAEFRGSVAERYRELERLLNRLLVAACCEHRYRIPFPQLTVHRAEG